VMPQRTCRELAREIAALLPDIKVIYTSGYTESAIVHQSVLAPGLAFLPKPFTAKALLTKVREVLDSPQRYGA
jgi:DNA-binding NarL/FixJ family response regulator